MSAVLAPPTPTVRQQRRLPFRLSVDQYTRMVEAGILGKYDRCELIEGLLVAKPMSRNPPHDGTLHALHKRLILLLQSGWEARDQKALVLDGSVPEPDIVVARGTEIEYRTRHPRAADTGLVVEVADSSLIEDRERAELFAANRISQYWIVNLIDNVIEEYTQPSGPSAVPSYGSKRDYAKGDSIPLILDGKTIAVIAVNDIIM